MDRHISEERLTAFVDGEVNESESDIIRDHLKTCDRCSAYIEEMRSLFTELEGLEPAPGSPGLADDTMQLWQIMKQTQPSRSLLSLQNLKSSYRFIAAGTVAAGLAVGILVGSIASLGLLPNEPNNLYSSIVLQENDHTINDTYIAMIINDERDF